MFGGATRALTNNLDLTVVQGTNTFLGNVFASGWSITSGVADDLNNVENVYIQTPGGVYDITVKQPRSWGMECYTTLI